MSGGVQLTAAAAAAIPVLPRGRLTDLVVAVLGVAAIATEAVSSAAIARHDLEVVAAGTLAVGTLLNVLGRTGGPLCRPKSVLQGHAAWHVLSAAGTRVLGARRAAPAGLAAGHAPTGYGGRQRADARSARLALGGSGQMTETHDRRRSLAEPYTPGSGNGDEPWDAQPDTVAVAPPTVPGRDERTAQFLAEWHNGSYNCFSSGHKFCREVCPVVQVTRNESWSPTAFHANVVAMERGHLDVTDVAADYVNCTQCGACELRCPNTLFTGDFYRFRTRTVDVVKAMRALAVEQGVHQPEWQRWNSIDR